MSLVLGMKGGVFSVLPPLSQFQLWALHSPAPLTAIFFFPVPSCSEFSPMPQGSSACWPLLCMPPTQRDSSFYSIWEIEKRKIYAKFLASLKRAAIKNIIRSMDSCDMYHKLDKDIVSILNILKSIIIVKFYKKITLFLGSLHQSINK